jgi:hypothetical protein
MSKSEDEMLLQASVTNCTLIRGKREGATYQGRGCISAGKVADILSLEGGTSEIDEWRAFREDRRGQTLIRSLPRLRSTPAPGRNDNTVW